MQCRAWRLRRRYCSCRLLLLRTLFAVALALLARRLRRAVVVALVVVVAARLLFCLVFVLLGVLLLVGRDGIGLPVWLVARLAFRLAVLDPAGPGARGLAARLDEGLEAVEVRLGGALVDAQAGAELLDEALRLPVEHDLDAGQLRRELVERDHADSFSAALELPGDPLVRNLLRDLGLPVPAPTPDVLVPDDEFGLLLLHRLDAVQERVQF